MGRDRVSEWLASTSLGQSRAHRGPDPQAGSGFRPVKARNRAQKGKERMKRIGIIEKKTKAEGILNPITPRLLTLKAAGELLGLSTWALRERVWSGQIPVVRFPGGRKLYIDTRDLEAFVQQNKISYRR